jgi:hypothetical protein
MVLLVEFPAADTRPPLLHLNDIRGEAVMATAGTKKITVSQHGMHFSCRWTEIRKLGANICEAARTRVKENRSNDALKGRV